MFVSHLNAVSGLICLMFVLGCSSQPPRVYQIDADPADLAACLLETGDTNKDGALSKEEFAQLPYIASMARHYDTDQNGQLTAEELAERLGKVVFDPERALTTGECRVLRKGKPLAGARVRLAPAPCLEEYLPVATGIVDPEGIARLTMEAENRPANAPKIAGLVRPGLYLIEVTHPSIPVPPQYNAETTLGAEASTATLANGAIAVNLDF